MNHAGRMPLFSNGVWSLIFAVLAAGATLLVLAVPTEAQENTARNSAQAWQNSDRAASQAEPSGRELRQAEPNDLQGELAGEEVDAQDRNANGVVDLATIQAENCTIDPAGATLTIEDSDGTTGLLADGANVEMEATDTEIRIVGTGPDGDIFFGTVGGEGAQFVGDATVLRSTGVDCAGGGDGDAVDDDVADGDVDDATDDQYGDGVNDGDVVDGDVVDGDVADDAAADVVDDTVPDKPLPNTGGVPLYGLLIVGFALVCGGSVVLRSGIRREG